MKKVYNFLDGSFGIQLTGHDFSYGYPQNFGCSHRSCDFVMEGNFYHDQVAFLLEEGVKVTPYIIARLGLDRD